MSKIIKLQAEIDLKSGRIGVGDPDLWHQLGCFMEVVAMLAAATIGDNPKKIKDAEEMADYVAGYITMAMEKAQPQPKSSHDGLENDNAE